MVQKPFIYVFTLCAVLALIFLIIAYWLLQTTWSGTIFSNNQLTGAAVSNGTQLVFDDPLITTVPEDQRSSQQKTNVFISSLDPISGSADAKVFVILYGSLLDEDMQTYLEMMTTIAAQYTEGDVAFVWKDYATDAAEQLAAEVGHCAHEQGKFWEYARALPNRTGDDRAALLAVADSVGAITSDLETCLDTAGYDAQIQQNYYAGQTYGVINGHTMFVNDRLYTETIAVDNLTQSINEILASYE